MDTLTNLRRDLVNSWTGEQGDFERWCIDHLDAYIDARIAAAIRPTTVIRTESACVCTFKNGRVDHLCGTHEREFELRNCAR